jgi:F-type H+-transporting ATPase subunit a
MQGAPSIELIKLVPVLKDMHAEHLASSIVVVVFILLFSYLATKNLRKKKYSLIPSDKFNFQNMGELIVDLFANTLKSSIGKEGIKYIPVVGTLGLFILFSNLSGLVPGLLPPTDNINTTAGCALVVFFATHIIGFKKHGLKYLKQFVGPFWWLAWLMIPLEIISHCARPLSLSLRLFGNIMGDHLILTIFIGLVPFLVPVPVLVLGLFVSLVQTIVFVLLSTVYIAGAVAEGH